MRKNLLAMFAFFMLAGVVAMLVGVRNALVMMSVTAVGTALRLPRRYRLGFVAVALVVVASVSLSPIMKERLQRFTELGTMTFEQYDQIISGRLTIWETAGKMFVDRPLTGVGAGVFARVYELYSTRANDPFRPWVIWALAPCPQCVCVDRSRNRRSRPARSEKDDLLARGKREHFKDGVLTPDLIGQLVDVRRLPFGSSGLARDFPAFRERLAAGIASGDVKVENARLDDILIALHRGE